MAVRPYFQRSRHLDMSRYFRIVYGPEYYTWQGTSLGIVYENNLGVLCQRDQFQVSDQEWD